MGQQLKARIKRTRRNRWEERKKEATRKSIAKGSKKK